MRSLDQYLPNAEPEVYASPLLAKSLKGLPPARKYKAKTGASAAPDIAQWYRLRVWIPYEMRAWHMRMLSKKLGECCDLLIPVRHAS